jgi:hypothetical protein
MRRRSRDGIKGRRAGIVLRALLALLACVALPVVAGVAWRALIGSPASPSATLRAAPAPPPSSAPPPKGETLTEQQKADVDALNAIGYLPGTNPAPKVHDVTIYKKGLAYDGPSLYVSGHAPEATLIDMEGKVLHTWTCPFNVVWPGRPTPEQGYGHLNWRRAYVYPNGDLLAIFEGVGLVKLDKDSELQWVYPGNAHHDLDVLENGDIYVLSRTAHMIPRINKEKPILEDFITLLDANGQPKQQLSILDAAERSEFWPIIWGLMPKEGDIFHTNTLQFLDGSRERISPLFKKGNILTSIKHLNLIGIIDMEAGKFVWCKLGPWLGQHEPTLLENGHILLFDNNRFCDYSRVVEFEPFTDHIVWYYLGTPPNSFFTEACGSCQPLPNGNVIAVASEQGRAIEITRNKEIVWEFYNPHTVAPNKETIAYLSDLVRLSPDLPLDWTRAHAGKPETPKTKPAVGQIPRR